MYSSFWHKTLIPSAAPHLVEAGEVRLFLRVDEGDWLLGILRDEGDRSCQVNSGIEVPAEHVPWQRIGSVEDLPVIHVCPSYPDRAVVVRPEMPYSVLPGERVQFYVGVPVWIRLVGKGDVTLAQVPVNTLSNTWFGAPTDGELAFAMRTRARREGERLDFGALRVTCPVRVKNHTSKMLTFERICIRPKFLSLYEDKEKGLWANESSVIVRSDGNWSQVAYARKPPKQLSQPKVWLKGEEESTRRHVLRALSTGTGFFNE
jgi:hypothetical protein